MKVRDLGEDRLIEQLLPRLSLRKAVATAPGDDCAVVEAQHRRKLLVLKTDCVVERVHFLRGTNAFNVGWKAMMRPLSDFAATSAVPQFALITLMAPKQTEVAWVKELYRGLRRAAKRFEVSIVGGETSSTPGPVAISTSVVGFVERDRAVSRRGGKAGDDLFVTGRLGGGLKQKHLQFIPRIAESRWLTRWRICRSPVAQSSMTQFPKAKITNCYSPFHRAIVLDCSEHGRKNSPSCYLLELARSIENRKPKI